MEAGTILGFTVRVQDDYDSDAVHAIMMIEIVGRSTADVAGKLRAIPEISAPPATQSGRWLRE